jgi:hypothetical protein
MNEGVISVNMVKGKPRHTTRSQELQELIRKAMENPGVADVVRAYGEYEQVEEVARTYLDAAKMPTLFSVSDSSSQ